MSNKQYFKVGDISIEYSPSGRSLCKYCKNIVNKGQLRIGIWAKSPFYDGTMPIWFHMDCYFYRKFRTSSNRNTQKKIDQEKAKQMTMKPTDIHGFSSLQKSDKNRLCELLFSMQGIKPDEKEANKQIFLSETPATSDFVTSLDFSLVPLNLQSCSEVDLQEVAWKIRKELFPSLKNKFFKDFLKINSQDDSGGRETLETRLCDLLLYGPITLKCPGCKHVGFIYWNLEKKAYLCTGDVSAWVRCPFSSEGRFSVPHSPELIIPNNIPSPELSSWNLPLLPHRFPLTFLIANDDSQKKSPSCMNNLIQNVDPQISVNNDIITNKDPQISVNNDIITNKDPQISVNNDIITNKDPQISVNNDITNKDLTSDLSEMKDIQEESHYHCFGNHVVPQILNQLPNTSDNSYQTALNPDFLNSFVSNFPSFQVETVSEFSPEEFNDYKSIHPPLFENLSFRIHNRKDKKLQNTIRKNGGHCVLYSAPQIHYMLISQRHALLYPYKRSSLPVVLDVYIFHCVRLNTLLPIDKYRIDGVPKDEIPFFPPDWECFRELPKTIKNQKYYSSSNEDRKTLQLFQTPSYFAETSSVLNTTYNIRDEIVEKVTDTPASLPFTPHTPFKQNIPKEKKRTNRKEAVKISHLTPLKKEESKPTVEKMIPIKSPLPSIPHSFALEESPFSFNMAKDLIDSSFEASDLHIFYSKEHSMLYDVILNYSDISTGENKFYQLQIAKHDHKNNQFQVLKRWGRTGEKTSFRRRLNKTYFSFKEALDDFEETYLLKTSNPFKHHLTPLFEKKPRSYFPIEIIYQDDKEKNSNKELGNPDVPSRLDPRVANLIEYIFNTQLMEQQVREFQIDLKKMPLGKLSRERISQAFLVLKEIEDRLLEGDQRKYNKYEQKHFFTEKSNQFFTYIPHVVSPFQLLPLLDSLDLIVEKMKMLESLGDIEIASQLIDKELAGKHKKDTMNPLDIKYDMLKTDIVPLEQNNPRYGHVQRYLENYDVEKAGYSLDILNIFQVRRNNESDLCLEFFHQHTKENRQLLWHGSRSTNYVGILSQGLRIAPPEAPSTGYMFGKGVYLADVSFKSADFCHASPNNPTGLLLLCTTTLGPNSFEIEKAQYIEKDFLWNKGYYSTKGLGKWNPHPFEGMMIDDDTLIPFGTLLQSENPHRALDYNEFIVYDTRQVMIQYLVEVKFNFFDENLVKKRDYSKF